MRIPAAFKLPHGIGTPDVYFSTHEVGPLPGFEIVVSAEDAQRWRHIAGMAAGPGVPPSILYYPSQNLIGRELHSGGGFARYTCEFLAPIPIDRPITITGAVVDKFARRGRGYVRWEMLAHDGATLLQRSWKNWSFRLTAEEAASLGERPSEDRADSDEPAIEQLGPLALEMSPERLADFEGPGEVNSHTSVEVARAAGYAAQLAQGGISYALITRLLCERFGDSVERGGVVDVRFVKPVFAGQTVVAVGEIVAQEAGVARCRVRVEDESGGMLSLGTAVVPVAQSTKGSAA